MDRILKFGISDQAIVCSNKGETSNEWLKHFIEIGKKVEISGFYNGWKGHEAYTIKNSSEILLAEELEMVN